jgi:hypothetical protein
MYEHCNSPTADACCVCTRAIDQHERAIGLHGNVVAVCSLYCLTEWATRSFARAQRNKNAKYSQIVLEPELNVKTITPTEAV